MRTVYVNGEYVAERDAKISVFDRGFLFGDGVYEVSTVLDGKLVDNAAHLARLDRSLQALSIPSPAGDDEILEIQRQLIVRNALEEGVVYLQVTRGAADRSFDWPEQPAPSLVMFTQAKPVRGNPKAEVGLSVALVPDLRWKRRDIKTVTLLPASWAKMQAAEQGCDDAWMVEADEDGVERVTEGSSNNAFIVTADGVLVTRNLGDEILHGITRRSVLQLAAEIQLRVEERAFTPEEAKAATEAFITSASSFVMPVVQIDGAVIGDGAPGPISRRLRSLYIATAESEAI
ncbi:MAG: D-amino-acid transaminase [Rhodobacteraceae bacterium]|nr:D-amino-acid transaminase [Paracoccaceae bacterium]